MNQEKKIFTVKHSGDMGDIVASLAAVKEICDRDGAKAHYILDASGGYLNPNVKFQAPNGTKFNAKSAEFLKPLIEAQPYIDSVEIDPYGMQNVDYDLNEFRRAFVNREAFQKTNQNLVYLHQYSLGLPLGYHGPWLADPKAEGEANGVLFARTVRYQSAHVMWEYICQNLKNKGIVPDFIGTDVEEAAFKECFPRATINRVKVESALDMAKQIALHQEVVVNGTLLYWIAVGLGHPSIVHEEGLDIPTTHWRDEMENLTYIMGARRMRGAPERKEVAVGYA